MSPVVWSQGFDCPIPLDCPQTICSKSEFLAWSWTMRCLPHGGAQTQTVNKRVRVWCDRQDKKGRLEIKLQVPILNFRRRWVPRPKNEFRPCTFPPTSHSHAAAHSKVCNSVMFFEVWKWHSTRHAPALTAAAQCAFKISMIHWVVQFALRIAFRSVLHRYTSRGIHRWKSSIFD